MQKGLCTPDDVQKCAEKYGAGLAWTCENCPKSKTEDIHQYTWKMIRIYNLQQGGFPFQKNDLTLEEWEDLGRVRVKLNPAFCPFMGGGEKK